MGNQWVIIEGQNFGTIEQNAIDLVTYGFDGRGYTPCPMAANSINSTCECSVIESHTKINCTTVPGTGADLKWTVVISDQKSTVPSTAYGPPVITSFTGNGAINASTEGGQTVYIHGYNFGPNSSDIGSITYGPTGFEYDANNCTLMKENILIRCETIPGLGGSLFWTVEVGGQFS